MDGVLYAISKKRGRLNNMFQGAWLRNCGDSFG